MKNLAEFLDIKSERCFLYATVSSEKLIVTAKYHVIALLLALHMLEMKSYISFEGTIKCPPSSNPTSINKMGV